LYKLNNFAVELLWCREKPTWIDSREREREREREKKIRLLSLVVDPNYCDVDCPLPDYLGGHARTHGYLSNPFTLLPRPKDAETLKLSTRSTSSPIQVLYEHNILIDFGDRMSSTWHESVPSKQTIIAAKLKRNSIFSPDSFLVPTHVSDACDDDLQSLSIPPYRISHHVWLWLLELLV
jgi:hypothetical protein